MNNLLKVIQEKRKPIIITGIVIVTILISLYLANGGSRDGDGTGNDSDNELTDINLNVDTNTPDEEQEPTKEDGQETSDDDTSNQGDIMNEDGSYEGLEDELDEESMEPIGPNSILTGLPIHQEAFDRRPIGIMISNIETALPQSGLSQADVIYEALVEGGITRLFALYQDFDAEKIGPIRSARHYYLYFTLEHDAIYTHVGQSEQAKSAFRRMDVDRFYGISYLDLILTYQDEERRPPHSTFTSFDHLMATWEELDYRVEPKEDLTPKFTFEEDYQLEGEPLNKVSLNYSKIVGTNPYFVYDEELGQYLRYQFDEPHIDAVTGEQLAFENVIIQFVSMWSIKGDTEGRQDMSLIDEGTGYYIQGGKMIPILWSKSSEEEPTVYTTEDGTPITMSPGKTFICVYPSYYKDNLIME